RSYQKVKQGDDIFYVAKEAVETAIRGPHEIVGDVTGSEMLGWRYRGPFDELPAEQNIEHRVIPWEDVGAAEGTGIVHIAPGAGREDYQLGKEHDLPIAAPLDENGVYLDGFGWLTGMN